MKKLIYIFMAMIGIVMAGCSAESAVDLEKGGLNTKTPDTEQPKDTTTHKWNNCDHKDLPIIEMIATPHIYWSCTNNQKDTCQMEAWLLEIKTADMTIYRNYYQPTIVSGRSLDAQRSTDPETKDKYGNLVTRHYYTQEFEFNNFTHSISGAWTTGRIIYGNGKEESYLPYDGLYYSIENLTGVGDTTQFVRNDSIFAVEKLTIEYKASLHKDPNVLNSWESWKRTATVTVISFVGMVEHEEEIPTADIYIPGLTKGCSANRFPMGDNFWGDGILLPSTGNNYYILYATFKVDDGKETQLSLKLDSIAKSAMATPLANDPYNAVMWDPDTNRPIPCHISVDGKGFGLGVRYADGSVVTKRHEYNAAVINGIKNLSEEDNATPTPFIATKWNVLYEKDGKAIYNLEWHTNGKDGKPIHTIGTKVGDLSFKK